MIYKICKYVFLFLIAAQLISCGPTRPPEHSEGHITKDTIPEVSEIPQPVEKTTLLPVPKPRPKLETYTVIVSDVPAKDLLFSLARDAKLNLDIHNDIQGNVTLNAIDQTLPQLLKRLSNQVDIRYEILDGVLRVRADTPFFRTYKVDYVNMKRNSKGKVSVATTVGSAGESDIGDSSGSGGTSSSSSSGSQGDNSSVTEINNESENNFWDTLEKNITLILTNSSYINLDAEGGEGGVNNPSTSILINKETGLVAVNATSKQHVAIQKFIDQVLNNAKRQVMIEATIAEIKLSDRYQAGVDWSLISSDSNGVSIISDVRDGALGQLPFSAISIDGTVDGDPLNVTMRALEQFGDVKVLSSPKVMAINNQPAILKVVDNIVYFETEVETQTNENIVTTTFETDIKTVPVGFVMSVTPYISEADVVTLNIRPTISRVLETVNDPNPALKEADVVSEVPVIQIREIESVLQINSGDTAVIGGLMQDAKNDQTNGVPVLSSIPIIGNLFKYEDDYREKSELIIFIKPVVVKHASLTGDLVDYQKFLPAFESNDPVTE